MVICCVSLLYGVVYDIPDWNCEVPPLPVLLVGCLLFFMAVEYTLDLIFIWIIEEVWQDLFRKSTSDLEVSKSSINSKRVCLRCVVYHRDQIWRSPREFGALIEH